ncbi:hypothetical protein ZWY2020_058945 [Hordeum vulgare]|nr:hypothetical protein ZWY2020_058945 [Hordeum vulgare]
MPAAGARRPPSKGKGPSPSPPASGVAGAKKRKRVLPPLLPPGTAVEVLRNGSWVGGGTVTIRNGRTYMVRLPDGMTVLMSRGRVRPAATE